MYVTAQVWCTFLGAVLRSTGSENTNSARVCVDRRRVPDSAAASACARARPLPVPRLPLSRQALGAGNVAFGVRGDQAAAGAGLHVGRRCPRRPAGRSGSRRGSGGRTDTDRRGPARLGPARSRAGGATTESRTSGWAATAAPRPAWTRGFEAPFSSARGEGNPAARHLHGRMIPRRGLHRCPAPPGQAAARFSAPCRPDSTTAASSKQIRRMPARTCSATSNM